MDQIAADFDADVMPGLAFDGEVKAVGAHVHGGLKAVGIGLIGAHVKRSQPVAVAVQGAGEAGQVGGDESKRAAEEPSRLSQVPSPQGVLAGDSSGPHWFDSDKTPDSPKWLRASAISKVAAKWQLRISGVRIEGEPCSTQATVLEH